MSSYINDFVFDYLRGADPVHKDQLLADLADNGDDIQARIHNQSVKEAVWDLLDTGKLQVNSDGLLEIQRG